MKRSLTLAIGLAALACSSAPPAQPPSPEPGRPAGAAITEPAITARDLETRLTTFAHDSMMGRESGTLGNVKATDYIAAEIRRMGLEPAGEDGTYFQTLPLIVRAVDPNSSITVDGTSLTLWTDFMPLPSFRGLPFPLGANVDLDGVPVIYGGQLGDTANMVSPEQAAGKLVVFAPTIGMAAALGWFRDYESVAGIAIVSLHLMPQNFKDFLSRPRTMLAGGAPPQGPLGLLVTLDAAEALLGAPLGQVDVGAEGKTVRGKVHIVDQPTPYPARNVIGIVPGSDPTLRDEYVAIGSHNDHEGIAGQAIDHDSIRAFNRVVRPMGAESPRRRPNSDEQQVIDSLLAWLRAERAPRPDSIYNGADDDGSGSVAMLEVAEAFAAADEKPRRSILFVWHTAEEKGLFGARYFTDNPTVPREAIVADLNLDMVGRGSEGEIEGGGPGYLQIIGSRRLSTELGDIIEAVNESGGFGFEFDYQFDAEGHPQQYYCRSDHYMYARYGIPIAFFSTGSHVDYHQVTDEAEYINYRKMARVSQLVFAIAETVANLDHRVVIDKPKPDPNAPCRQ